MRAAVRTPILSPTPTPSKPPCPAGRPAAGSVARTHSRHIRGAELGRRTGHASRRQQTRPWLLNQQRTGAEERRREMPRPASPCWRCVGLVGHPYDTRFGRRAPTRAALKCNEDFHCSLRSKLGQLQVSPARRHNPFIANALQLRWTRRPRNASRSACGRWPRFFGGAEHCCPRSAGSAAAVAHCSLPRRVGRTRGPGRHRYSRGASPQRQ